METHLQVGKIRDYIKGNQKGHIKMYKHPNFWFKEDTHVLLSDSSTAALIKV